MSARAASATDPDVQDLQNVFQGRYGNVVGKPLLAEAGGKSVVVCSLSRSITPVSCRNTAQLVEFPPQVWLEAIDAKNGATGWRRQWEMAGGNLREKRFVCGNDLEARRPRRSPRSRVNNRLYGFDVLTGQPAWPDRKLDESRHCLRRSPIFAAAVEPELVLLKGRRDLRLTQSYRRLAARRSVGAAVDEPRSHRASWTVGRDRWDLAGHSSDLGRKGKTANRRAFRRSREPC